MSCTYRREDENKQRQSMTTEKFREYVYLTSKDFPVLPSIDELPTIRKGLRKKAPPDLTSLPDEYEYESVGFFIKQTVRNRVRFHWKTVGVDSKEYFFDELCRDPHRELDRLELGWMIANFAAVDGSGYLGQLRPISYEDYHQDQFNRQYNKQKKHFLGIVAVWRHWAVVSAGHMKFL